MKIVHLRFALLTLLLLLVSCASPVDRKARVVPAGSHDEEADRATCLKYAELYGVINLGPMLGDKVENRPDRQRRDHLFVICMQEKGYRF